MSSVVENNKRIARNTIFLYIRLLFAMAVGLYTSRVVLATLGVDDFGLNAVVTSAITIFFFLNSSMASATSRFLTFELGKGDTEKLKKTFSAALTIHILIAITILVLGETVGLWYLENKMVIPEGRMTAARWVYQLSLVSAMLTITQVPYNATIIAHERMNVYAYIEILQTCLKLGIVFLLVVGNLDKLILYAILTLCVTIIVTVVYRIYCIRHFTECRYKFHRDKEIIYPMLSFSGWNLFGLAGVSAKKQGINIIVNLFFSTAVNAAYGLALQVSGAIEKFATNFMVAGNPQIIKYYALGQIEKMQSLVNNLSKMSYLILLAFCVPIMLETDFVLSLWLSSVPRYTNILCLLFLLITLFCPFISSLNTVIEATARIKHYTILRSVLSFMILLVSYILFKMGNRLVFLPLLIIIVERISLFMLTLITTRGLIPKFSIKNYLLKSLSICIGITVIALVIPVFLHLSMDTGWLRFIVITLSSLFGVGFSTYYIALDREMREKLIIKILKKIKIVQR